MTGRFGSTSTTRRGRGAPRAMVAAVILAASMMGTTTAGAADQLVLANAHVAGYPAVVLSVDAPATAGALAPADVDVTENGVPVDATVTRLADEGLEIVLVVDTSDAAGPEALSAARAAATRFVDRMPERVRVGLVAFGPDVRLLTAPTRARATVGAAIAALQGGGDAPLYDAAVAAGRAFTANARERLVVFFAASGDVGSASPLGDAVAALAGQRVEVVSWENPNTSPLALARLAIEGRGDVVAVTDAPGIDTAFRRVADAIVGRYTIAYTSTAHGPVDVRVVTRLGELRAQLDLPAADGSGPPAAPPVAETIVVAATPTTMPATTAPTAPTAAAAVAGTVAPGEPTVLDAAVTRPPADDATATTGGGGLPWTIIEIVGFATLVALVGLYHLAARQSRRPETPPVVGRDWGAPAAEQVVHQPVPVPVAPAEPELQTSR